MDTIISFLCEHADKAPYVIFFLLLLTGFSIPISEDLIILIAGAIVSICIPTHFFKLFLFAYFGSLFSAWIAYWIGRTYGEKIYQISWFERIITKKRIDTLHHYYEKFGVFTFVIGRLFPGGIRNTLFMIAGLGKMPFWIFCLRDSLAALFSVSLFFNLGYFFGTHYKVIIDFIKTYELIVIVVFIIAFVVFLKFNLKK